MQKRAGLYVHIPFCVKKCNYCAFLSFDAKTSPLKEYTDALLNEIQLRGKELGHPEIDTVYVGGGTPSVLDITQMRDIMHAIGEAFRIKEGAEITIEANPATLGQKDEDVLVRLQAYKNMGFNRLSMGVQSMDNDRLRFLGRIHTAENVVRDMKLARQKGFDNINLDLIFSVPGESVEDALSDLERIIELGPEHISCYSLQIEEGTPFGRMAEEGELSEVPDEEDRETYHRICSMLRDAGYEHYEISNFAKMYAEGAERAGRAPGFCAEGKILAVSPFRSRHNSLYWDMSDYIGLGLGASGFVNGRRYKNISDMEWYISFFSGADVPEGDAACRSDIPLEEDHLNDSFDNISEAVFTGLRRREGISYSDALGEQAGADEKSEFWHIFSDAASEAEAFADNGLLLIDDEGIRLTEQGIDISNSIMSLFV